MFADATYRLQEAAAEEEGRRAVAAEERRGRRRGEEGRRVPCKLYYVETNITIFCLQIEGENKLN
jgi:hypothetical protein